MTAISSGISTPRGNGESAVYRVVGPLFQGQAAAYRGVRVS